MEFNINLHKKGSYVKLTGKGRKYGIGGVRTKKGTAPVMPSTIGNAGAVATLDMKIWNELVFRPSFFTASVSDGSFPYERGSK